MSITAFITLFLGYTLSFIIVYSRTYRVSPKTVRLLMLTSLLACIILISYGENIKSIKLLVGFASSPLVIGILFISFNLISRYFFGREFLLHAKSSIEYLKYRRTKTFKWYDILFSSILILFWVGWPMLFVLILSLL